jgi:hypothetical protein
MLRSIGERPIFLNAAVFPASRIFLVNKRICFTLFLKNAGITQKAHEAAADSAHRSPAKSIFIVL